MEFLIHQDLNHQEETGLFYLLMMRLKKTGKYFMRAGMPLKIILLFHVVFTILVEPPKKSTMMMIQPMVHGGILQVMGLPIGRLTGMKVDLKVDLQVLLFSMNGIRLLVY